MAAASYTTSGACSGSSAASPAPVRGCSLGPAVGVCCRLPGEGQNWSWVEGLVRSGRLLLFLALALQTRPRYTGLPEPNLWCGQGAGTWSRQGELPQDGLPRKATRAGGRVRERQLLPNSSTQRYRVHSTRSPRPTGCMARGRRPAPSMPRNSSCKQTLPRQGHKQPGQLHHTTGNRNQSHGFPVSSHYNLSLEAALTQLREKESSMP